MNDQTPGVEAIGGAGRYGHQVVGGVIDVAAHERYEPVLGIPLSMQYAFGSLYGPDGEYFWPIRGFYLERARHLHLSTSVRGGDFSYAPEGTNAYEGPVTHGQVDGRYASMDDDGVPILSTDGTTLDWVEHGGVVDVHGQRHGHALQFHSVDATAPLVYTSAAFRMSGTVLDVPVTGWVFHDTLHLPTGMHYINSPYLQRLQGAWVAFVTEFADGNVHAGHLIWGTEGFQMLIVERSDGPPVIARDVEIDWELDDDRYPQRVTYRTLQGETWTWTAVEGGRTPKREDITPDHRWRQGVVRRDGDDREVVSSEALMEIYADRLPPSGKLA